MLETTAIEFLDLHPPADHMLEQVCAGLVQAQKRLPSQYFYDATGARLFEQICELDEYYLTRTELAILDAALPDITHAIGGDAGVIEPGSGSGIKTRLLLDALHEPTAYMPIDVARDQLLAYAQELAEIYPGLSLCPVCGDFTHPFPLPEAVAGSARPLIYFPGSTIGNFPPPQARALLRRWRDTLGEDGLLLIGVDLQKPAEVLHAAYDDAQGVTAAFNRNILSHINNRLDADFDVRAFSHRATYDPDTGFVQMWLVSAREQQVQIGDEAVFEFQAGETVLTEYSCKYRLSDFAALAGDAGWAVERVWTDERDWFSVQLLRAL